MTKKAAIAFSFFALFSGIMLSSALGAALDREVDVAFSEDPELIAGVRVTLGDWTLGARVNNLLDKEYSDFGANASDGSR